MNKVFGSILGLMMLLLTSGTAGAVYLHQFACNNCHVAGTSLYTSGNSSLCVQCHSNGGTTITTDDGRNGPESYFDQNDLSNAMGMLPFTPTEQTAHSWVAMRDDLPAAGATPSTETLYYSNYGASYNKVTCTKCHNPHATYSGTSGTGQNLSLRLDNSDDGICLDCHTLFYDAPADALATHPVDIPLSGDSVRASIVEPAVVLINNGTQDVVSCSSCHGVHWTDSDATTDDGVDQVDPLDPAYTTGLNTGDGHLLVLDGLQTSGATTLETAQRHSILCQACHDYAIHGTVDESPIGCLDCHSGHSYDPDFPNYFILRKNVSTVPFGDKTDLDYSSLPGVWDDGVNSTADGYCEKCHGDVAGGASFSDGRPTHSSGEVCRDCHTHPGGFAGAGCDGCHGYPPPPAATGYALNENNLHHMAHAGGIPYSFACTYCHNAGTDASTHNMGSFQDVYVGGFGIDDFIDRAGAISPSYDGGTYACTAVYCHSNGGKRTGDGSVSYKTASITWSVGQVVLCSSCHGNTAATMAVADRDNSVAHVAHLGGGDYSKTYSCKFCHVDTAATANSLVAGAAGTYHVNGSHDVGFDTTTDNLGNGTLSYDSGTYSTGFDLDTGACMVYCHSDGKGNYAAADWDDATSGDCGACHGVTSATLTSGAHAKHIDTAGADVSCDSCHGTDASGGTHSGHIDGAITKLTTATSCDTCHGVELASGETWDVSPVWVDSSDPADNHVDCRTCHHGAATTSYTDASSTTRTAPAKTVFYSYGHGISGVGKPAKNCFDCHEGVSNTYNAAHMDSTAGDNRLLVQGGNAFETAETAYCSECHETTDVETVHYDTTGSSIAGNACATCHDPHGQGSLDAMIRTTIGSKTVVGFTDRTVRASYYTSTLVVGEYQGICQVCHDSTDVKYFNQTTDASATHGGGGVCISCHDHTNTPAFKANCFDCHGGGTSGTTSGFKNYWPDDSTTDAENDGGAHEAHILEIAKRQGFATIDDLLNDAAADAEQIAICGYCHAAGPNDDDHGTTGDAEVFSATVNSSVIQVAKALWGADDAATVASYTASSDTCSNVDCHNNKTTPTSPTDFSWYGGASGTCTLCHTRATSGSNPSSGLHYGSTAPTVSGQWHDDTLTGGCIACHTDLPANDSTAASTHIDSFFTGDGSNATDLTNMGLFSAYTNGGSDNIGSCSGTLVGDTAGCHGSDGNGATPNGDDGTWAREWDSSVSYATDGTQCAGCHGTFSGWAWNEAEATTTDHTDPYSGNTGDKMDQHTVCSICHGSSYGDTNYDTTWGGTHGDGKIEMNGPAPSTGAGYDDSTGGCAKACHGPELVMSPDSGWTANFADYGAGTCDGCHDVAKAAAAGAPAIVDISGAAHNGTAYGTHLQAATESLAAVTDWSAQCNKCHTFHADGTTGVNDVEISTIYNRGTTDDLIPTLSEQYAGHDSYIQLGGTATAGYAVSTEAELCWSCHDAQATKISEWGTNTQTNGLAGRNYDFGEVYTSAAKTTTTSRWIGTYWVSANFAYKEGFLNDKPTTSDSVGDGTNNTGSTHAANIASGVSGVDSAANIRCTYCHNVHNGSAGDGTTGGAPYLRGTWMGNPYYEDGAPQSGTDYATLADNTTTDPTLFRPVPRGTNNSGAKMGGFWIDQNSGYPTATSAPSVTNGVWDWSGSGLWTLASSGGLCMTCHSKDSGGGAVTVDSLNYFGTASTDWVGSNGHSNAVIGGSGSGKANIFSTMNRNNSDSTANLAYTGTGSHNLQPVMAYVNANGEWGGSDGNDAYGYRGFNKNGTYPIGSLLPQIGDGIDSTPYAYSGYTWGARIEIDMDATDGDGADSFTDTQYHQFSCSKCHNPHASRLPRLMISNCLDTKNNTWDDDYQIIPATITSTYNKEVTWSNSSSAQNCHRRADPSLTNGQGGGWNNVTPW